MRVFDVDPEIVAYSLISLLIAAVLAYVMHDYAKHQAFLKSHGCQLLTQAPTGRQVYCGKACFRPEKVYVYECADGTRTEIH